MKFNLTALGKEKLVQSALGLTASQGQRVFAKAIVSNGVLDDRDIDLVMEEKKQIIRESRSLEFYTQQETPEHVGGLGVLKEWLRLRERAFSQEASAAEICVEEVPKLGGLGRTFRYCLEFSLQPGW